MNPKSNHFQCWDKKQHLLAGTTGLPRMTIPVLAICCTGGKCLVLKLSLGRSISRHCIRVFSMACHERAFIIVLSKTTTIKCVIVNVCLCYKIKFRPLQVESKYVTSLHSSVN